MSEWHLVGAAQAGDHEAFACLVQRHDAFLRGLVAHYVSGEDVDDAVQEIWSAVYRKLWQLERGDRFPAWLRTLVYYQCVNFRKARQRHRRVEAYLSADGWLHIAECIASDHLSVEELVERAETRNWVIRLLEGLPADYGQLLRLRFLHHLSYAEIAAIAGLPASSVKWRLHEARRLLKAAIMRQARKGEKVREAGGFRHDLRAPERDQGRGDERVPHRRARGQQPCVGGDVQPLR